jgi:hypothetical protein
LRGESDREVVRCLVDLGRYGAEFQAASYSKEAAAAGGIFCYDLFDVLFTARRPLAC